MRDFIGKVSIDPSTPSPSCGPYSTRILSNDIFLQHMMDKKRRELEMTFEVIVQQFRCRRERLEPNPAAEIDLEPSRISRKDCGDILKPRLSPSSAPINRLSACSISPPYVSASAAISFVKAFG